MSQVLAELWFARFTRVISDTPINTLISRFFLFLLQGNLLSHSILILFWSRPPSRIVRSWETLSQIITLDFLPIFFPVFCCLVFKFFSNHVRQHLPWTSYFHLWSCSRAYLWSHFESSYRSSYGFGEEVVWTSCWPGEQMGGGAAAGLRAHCQTRSLCVFFCTGFFFCFFSDPSSPWTSCTGRLLLRGRPRPSSILPPVCHGYPQLSFALFSFWSFPY